MRGMRSRLRWLRLEGRGRFMTNEEEMVSKQAVTGFIVAGLVLVAGLIVTGWPLNWYSLVAVIFAICAGFITYIALRPKS